MRIGACFFTNRLWIAWSSAWMAGPPKGMDGNAPLGSRLPPNSTTFWHATGLESGRSFVCVEECLSRSNGRKNTSMASPSLTAKRAGTFAYSNSFKTTGAVKIACMIDGMSPWQRMAVTFVKARLLMGSWSSTPLFWLSSIAAASPISHSTCDALLLGLFSPPCFYSSL